MKRFNKTNGMYALLIAVAAMIGITIYGSCSADEDYAIIHLGTSYSLWQIKR